VFEIYQMQSKYRANYLNSVMQDWRAWRKKKIKNTCIILWKQS